MSKEATFEDAFDALWQLQRELEDDGMDTPETIQAVISIDKLLHEAQDKYESEKPWPPHLTKVGGRRMGGLARPVSARNPRTPSR